MSWVIEHSKHKGNAFVVLLMIANHAKSDGTGAWPSVSTLAKEARISSRSVQYVTRRLERSGELETKVACGPGGSNLYSLPAYAKLAPPPPAVIAPPTQDDCAPPTQMSALPLRKAFAPEPSLKQPSINRPKAFVCPTIGEVISYCIVRQNSVDPQKFFDYYESNGWRVGRNPMKNWHAAVGTWEKNGFSNGGNGDSHKTSAQLRNERIKASIARSISEVADSPDQPTPLFKGTH